MSTKTNPRWYAGHLSGICIAFALAKLGGFIDWSWWWVASPLWGALILLYLLCMGIVLTKGIIANKKNKGKP